MAYWKTHEMSMIRDGKGKIRRIVFTTLGSNFFLDWLHETFAKSTARGMWMVYHVLEKPWLYLEWLWIPTGRESVPAYHGTSKNCQGAFIHFRPHPAASLDTAPGNMSQIRFLLLSCDINAFHQLMSAAILKFSCKESHCKNNVTDWKTCIFLVKSIS